MLTIQAARSTRFCDRLSRREAMRIGALGTLGLGLPQLLGSQAAASPSAAAAHASRSFGRAKRVILLFMWGGPAHQDTWDLKPDGPVELRGEFLPIATNVPGVQISEHFPLIARQADKLAILRSVGQEDNNHSTGAHAGLTGRRHELKAENFGARDTDFPHFGSVLSKLRPNRGGMPTFVSLPEVIATTAGVVTPGQFAGFLGKKYDPFLITDHPDEPDFAIDTLRLPGDISNLRMRDRRSLLDKIDDVARLAERSRTARGMDAFYQRALDMVLSAEARKAFDISRIPEAERWRYGWHTFGQSVLMARRLIEAGVQLVTVYWHREVKTIDTSWDTHSRNFTELKSRLMPSVDRPIAALLEDLAASGLLDETLVVWNSEFGRTPKINGNAGRDHWGPCNSVVMAGGGVPGGQVFGETDQAAAYPTRDKVTQDDIAATIYHLLGIDPETPVYDKTGRPFPVALGEPIHKLLGNECKPQPVPDPTPLTRTERGPFHRMLVERGRRFLCCELGNPNAATEWKLTGWSVPIAADSRRYRTIEKPPATIEYLGHFYTHFSYGYAVFHLAAPQNIDGVTLTLGGRAIPIPAELANAGPRTVWQVPFPDGMISSTKKFQLQVAAPDWKVADFAVTGDPIRDLHLDRVISSRGRSGREPTGGTS